MRSANTVLEQRLGRYAVCLCGAGDQVLFGWRRCFVVYGKLAIVASAICLAR